MKEQPAASSNAAGGGDPAQRLWRLASEQPLVHVEWPAVEWRSLLGEIERKEPDAARHLREHFEFIRDFAILPVVAVAGLLNAGKSSLVASLLSPAGAARVLRGVSAGSGTQRFTLWLPGSWRQREGLRLRVERELTRVFGHAPEPLASEPAQARAQQLRPDALRCPLLAWDDALDRQGLALLDCPDIQRHTPGEPPDGNARRDMLRKAGEICAGVILVARRTEIEVRDFHTITELLPSATRVYAINFLRRESAQEVARELRSAAGLPEGRVYCSYDYEVRANAPFAPAADPNFQRAGEAESASPFFFEANEQAPQAGAEVRPISEIGKWLEPEALRQRRQRELLGEFAHELREALARIESAVAASRRELAAAREDLFRVCLGFFREGENLRLKIDPEIADAMAEAIRRKAPWDIKPMLLVNHWVFQQLRRLRVGGVALAGKLNVPGRWLRKFEEVWRQRPASPFSGAALARALAAWAFRANPRSESRWEDAARDILERFADKERTHLPAVEWDGFAAELWRNTPVGMTRLKLASALVVALAALAIFPLLGGAAVIATTLHTTVIALTWKELLVAAGLGAWLGSDFARGLERMVNQSLGRQQVANFFAIAADRLGLPRDLPPGAADFPPPGIEPEPWPRSFGVEECGWREASVDPAAIESLRGALRRMVG